jgi:5-enolpyruvylshikimate-3-phosphate synthase
MVLKKFDLTVKEKISPFIKTIKVDSDKSISIRSFLIGAICHNISVANNVLESKMYFLQ